MHEGHCIWKWSRYVACGVIERPAGATSAARTRHPEPVYTLEHSRYKVSNELIVLRSDGSKGTCCYTHGQAEGVRRRRIPSCMVARGYHRQTATPMGSLLGRLSSHDVREHRNRRINSSVQVDPPRGVYSEEYYNIHCAKHRYQPCCSTSQREVSPSSIARSRTCVGRVPRAPSSGERRPQASGPGRGRMRRAWTARVHATATATATTIRTEQRRAIRLSTSSTCTRRVTTWAARGGGRDLRACQQRSPPRPPVQCGTTLSPIECTQSVAATHPRGRH